MLTKNIEEKNITLLNNYLCSVKNSEYSISQIRKKINSMAQQEMDRIKRIRRSFSTMPLTGEDLDDQTGLYVNTIEARTGNPKKSPIVDIYEACTEESPNYIHLLLGHRGCGKSTELNNLEKKLQKENYTLRKIDCQSETNLTKIKLEDVLILISDALLDICNEKGIDIDSEEIKILDSFFATIEKQKRIGSQKEKKIHSGIGIGFSKIIQLVAEVKGQIINTSDEMITIRETIQKRFSEWNECINNIIEKIKQADNLRHPIIIIENLDKIELEIAIEIFKDDNLGKICTYIVFTFPISLSYDAKFRAITQYATSHIFPMIDVKTKEGKRNEKGYETIKKIIEKRAELELFEEEALDLIIEKTGGSLRDVFRCIMEAAKYANRGEKDKIGLEEVNMALDDEKYNYLSRRISMKDYPALNEIHRTKNEIENHNDMLRFLEAHVVLEYNGKRWQDLHPLIYDFMNENGRIEQ